MFKKIDQSEKPGQALANIDQQIAQLDQEIARLEHRHQQIPDLIADQWGTDNKALEGEHTTSAIKVEAAQRRRDRLIRERQLVLAAAIEPEFTRLVAAERAAYDKEVAAQQKLADLKAAAIEQVHVITNCNAESGQARNAVEDFFNTHKPHLRREALYHLVQLHRGVLDPGTSLYRPLDIGIAAQIESEIEAEQNAVKP